ncbi:MAG: NHLP bacteriocin export ABC transporter permease/ATPase subunit [Oscillospiraceae bacterium]|nr:NHLP bacteriocin export ABC transporter permease/ATPase subunit [Oscillospiraceae bacterium]
MDDKSNVIHLYSTDQYVTETDGDAIRVLSGTVIVFIAPLKDGAPVRRIKLCEIGEGHSLPSFVAKDDDGTDYRFVLIPEDEADISLMPGRATSVLYKRFCTGAGLTDFATEGFSRSVIDRYQLEALKDNVFIGRGKKNDPAVAEETGRIIAESFTSATDRIEGNDPLYRTVAYACRLSNIDVVPMDKLAGSEITVRSIAKASRFICRNVVLEPQWYESDCGTVIGNIEGEPVACIPKGQSSYEIYYGRTEEKKKLTKEIAETVDPRAFTIARALPSKSLKVKDLIQFGIKSMRRADFIMVLILGLVGVLIGILLPMLNQKIYDDYIPVGDSSQLIQLCIVIATFMIANLFFDMVKKLSEYRISGHVGYDLQNAVYYRVFHLPESFFRDYDSADLAERINAISSFANSYVNTFVISGISTIFSLMYLVRMFKYSAKLTWIALLMLAVYIGIEYLLNLQTIKYTRKTAEASGNASARLYQYLSGIEKIRMSGAEDRAAFQYMIPFTEKESASIRSSRITSADSALDSSINDIFSMIFYLIVVSVIIKKNNGSLSVGSYMGFTSAFGAFSAAVISMMGSVLSILSLKPEYDRFRPVLETAPEDDENSESPGKLTGEITLKDVRFAYEEGGRNILDGISVTFKPGEYVGIVGSSGCGKSTLLKLLLGFETPKSGTICYDGKDLKTLDKREVRHNLGVVLQNGQLISGSIYENITITAPTATMDDVKQVIAEVGLKKDIERMPMGLHTVLSENCGTISGGQQQRILIARAIIGRPAILIFDEATSALDNLTQAAVCESLDKMKVTRLVVAHRLSTIKNCDRILVMDQGKIVEQGNHEELMKLGGLFYRLAARQISE